MRDATEIMLFADASWAPWIMSTDSDRHLSFRHDSKGPTWGPGGGGGVVAAGQPEDSAKCNMTFMDGHAASRARTECAPDPVTNERLWFIAQQMPKAFGFKGASFFPSAR